MTFELPITEIYKLNLLVELEFCHSDKAVDYLRLISRGDNIDAKREELTFLSDAIFYVNLFRVGTDDNLYLHKTKEKAMCNCDFSEEDLNRAAIEEPILFEDGTILLTETGTQYIQLEQ